MIGIIISDYLRLTDKLYRMLTKIEQSHGYALWFVDLAHRIMI